MDWFLYDRDFCHERVKGDVFLKVLINSYVLDICTLHYEIETHK